MLLILLRGRERETDKERGVLIGGRAEEGPALTKHYLATPTQSSISCELYLQVFCVAVLLAILL